MQICMMDYGNLSAANSGLYASGRMLWSLSAEKILPAAGVVFKRSGARYWFCRAVGYFWLCGGGGLAEHLRVTLHVPPPPSGTGEVVG